MQDAHNVRTMTGTGDGRHEIGGALDVCVRSTGVFFAFTLIFITLTDGRW